MYSIVVLSQIPVRSEPKESSEMVTQLLFGETYKLIESKNSWGYIESTHDRYRGWIDIKLLYSYEKFAIDNSVELDNPTEINRYLRVSSETAIFTDSTGEDNLSIVRGSRLPSRLDDRDKITDTVKIYNREYHFTKGEATTVSKQSNLSNIKSSDEVVDSICNIAATYINTPYLWGGRSPFGIDCSGLSQSCYASAGIDLPRDASQQALKGEVVNGIESSKSADLAFFSNDKGAITHVGIIIKSNSKEREIIHASGWVKSDNITQQGVVSKLDGKLTHKLHSIKRYI